MYFRIFRIFFALLLLFCLIKHGLLLLNSTTIHTQMTKQYFFVLQQLGSLFCVLEPVKYILLLLFLLFFSIIFVLFNFLKNSGGNRVFRCSFVFIIQFRWRRPWMNICNGNKPASKTSLTIHYILRPFSAKILANSIYAYTFCIQELKNILLFRILKLKY